MTPYPVYCDAVSPFPGFVPNSEGIFPWERAAEKTLSSTAAGALASIPRAESVKPVQDLLRMLSIFPKAPDAMTLVRSPQK